MKKLALIALILLFVPGLCWSKRDEPPPEPPMLNLGLRAMTGDEKPEIKEPEPIVISEELLRLAESGDVKAQIELGRLYYKDDQKEQAYKWLLRAAEQGDAEAQYALGNFYEFYRNNEFAYCARLKAYECYAKAAEQGHFAAQSIMSAYYSNAWFVPKDNTQAIYWAMQSYDNNQEYDKWLDFVKLYDHDDYFKTIEGWRRNQQRTWASVINFILTDEFEFNQEILSEAEFLAWVENKAAKGDIVGKALLGHMYYLGFLVERDYAKAYELYLETEAEKVNVFLSLNKYYKDAQQHNKIDVLTKKADDGDEEAQFILALNYYYGHNVRQNITKAVDMLRRLAEHSDDRDIRTTSAMTLGQIFDDYHDRYVESVGMEPFYVNPVARNYTEAAKWYMLLAEEGEMLGQYKMGDFYAKGLGVEQNYAKAIEWFTELMQRDIDAELKVAELSEDFDINDFEDYVTLFRTNAAYRIGLLYADANGNITDYGLAVKWLEQAAANKHEGAMFQLAQMYEQGKGVTQSYTKAAQLYRIITGDWLGAPLAARESNLYDDLFHDLLFGVFDVESYAYLALGDLYAAGNGVKLDLKQAFEYYQKAASNKLPLAQYALAKAYLNGAGVKQDFGKAYYYAKLFSQNQEATAEMVMSGQELMTEIVAQTPAKQKEWVVKGQFIRDGIDYSDCLLY